MLLRSATPKEINGSPLTRMPKSLQMDWMSASVADSSQRQNCLQNKGSLFRILMAANSKAQQFIIMK
jgi:hypothetical protein